MASIGLIQGANSINPTKDAFDKKSGQLDAERAADSKASLDAQTRKDNDFHRVVEYAGDGLIDEAKSYAEMKGIKIPQGMLDNADMAKGMAAAGTFYGNDPQGAQKFSSAWMQTRHITDLAQRVIETSKLAGPAIDPNDRSFDLWQKKEQWKLDNIPKGGAANGAFSLKPNETRYNRDGSVIASIPALPPVSRFEAGQKAYNEVAGSMRGDNETANIARSTALKYWDKAYGPQDKSGASPGLVGNDPLAQSQDAIAKRQSEIGSNPYQTPQNIEKPLQQKQPVNTPEQGVYGIQQLLMKGYTKDQIVQSLLGQGKDQHDIDLLFQKAGVQ